MRNRPILKILAAAAAIGVGASCSGADPVSPRVWAAQHCDAEARGLEAFTRSIRSSAMAGGASTPFEERLASGRAVLDAEIEGVDAYLEALIAIGPPDVTGGPDWYDDYVDATRRQAENTKDLAEQYVDEMGDLPQTSAPSRAEEALSEKSSKLLASIGEETEELEQANPAALTDYEGQCSQANSNDGTSPLPVPSYRNLAD